MCCPNSNWCGRNRDIEMNKPSISRKPDACFPVPGLRQDARLTLGQGDERPRSLAEAPGWNQLPYDLQKSQLEEKRREGSP